MSQRAAADERIMRFIHTKQPLDGGRIGQPDDLEGAAVYFLSDASRFVTGQVLTIDGGWSVTDGGDSPAAESGRFRSEPPACSRAPEHKGRHVDYAIGIHLGGTTAKMLAVTPRPVIGRAVAPTADATWRKHVARAFRSLVADVDGTLQWVGVAAPGLPYLMVDRSPPCRNVSPVSRGSTGKTSLHRVQRPVVYDAQGALLGETWLGAARGSRDVILLTLGTGVRGAILANGQLLRGKIGRAGHLGHVTVIRTALRISVGCRAASRMRLATAPSCRALAAASRRRKLWSTPPPVGTPRPGGLAGGRCGCSRLRLCHSCTW